MIDVYKVIILVVIAVFFVWLYIGLAMAEAETKRLKRQNKLLHTCLNDTWKINRELQHEVNSLKFDKLFYEMTHFEHSEN